MPAIDDSVDAQLLSQEEHAILLLARETRTPIATVQRVFLAEYKKLAANAHITSYLPLLTCNTVRGILGSAIAGRGGPPR